MKQAFFGISGHTIDAYFHTARLHLVGSSNSLELAVAFTDAPGVGALLGQSDFFQHHQIKFEGYKERIEIKQVKK